MPINSNKKGKCGEREVASLIREKGYEARRGQQYSGGGDSPDVVSELPIHIEVKRVEAGNPYNWLSQAKDDTDGKTPVVFHRRNNEKWIVILEADDFLDMFYAKEG